MCAFKLDFFYTFKIVNLNLEEKKTIFPEEGQIITDLSFVTRTVYWRHLRQWRAGVHLVHLAARHPRTLTIVGTRPTP